MLKTLGKLSSRWSLGLCVCLWSAATVSNADEIKLGTAPSNPTAAGFLLDVSAPRLAQEGYRPVRLRFKAVGQSFQRQRNLTIHMRPRGTYRTAFDYQFECSVSLPEGKKQFETVVMVPQFYRWSELVVRVMEDDQRLGRNNSVMKLNNLVLDQGQNFSLGVIVSSKAGAQANNAPFPDLRSFSTVFGNDQIYDRAEVFDGRQSRNFAETLTSGFMRVRTLDEDLLPQGWLGYSQLDVVLASYETIRRIEQTQPEGFTALLKWVVAGGQLWVYGTSKMGGNENSEFVRLCKSDLTSDLWIGKNVVLPKLVKDGMRLSETNCTTYLQYQPWNGSFYADQSGGNDRIRKNVYEKMVSSESPMTRTVPAREIQSQFDARVFGMGSIVCIHESDPFPGTFQFWYSIDRTVNPRRGNGKTNAVDYSSGNESCWWWMIDSVGRPPVTAFVISNGVFAITMGPVLYFWLRKKRRLFFLFFLAPALGLATTLGLFGYAFFSDGISSRARLRQLTWFDGRSVDASGQSPSVTETRHTYYTILGRSEGLIFDRDTLAMPMVRDSIYERYVSADGTNPGPCSIRQTGDQLRFGGDFLQTRMQSQFLTTRPDYSGPPVDLQPTESGYRVTNLTGEKIQRFGYRDDGGVWLAENVPVDGSMELREVSTDPFGLVAQNTLYPSANEWVLSIRISSQFQLSERTLVESEFDSWTRAKKPGSFFCLTEVPESEFALPDCRKEKCTRLIGGFLK
ncbi:MAG: hypothetical protein AAF802_23575 [Planctomycetota bacterium]